MKRMLAGVAAIVMLAAVGCSKPSTAPEPEPARTSASAPVSNISAGDLLAKIKAGEKLLVVDVRTKDEFAQGHVPGAQLVDLQTIEQGITKYAKDQELYLICRSGNRSAQAYAILQGMGYTKLHNITGGMTEWEKLGGAMER